MNLLLLTFFCKLFQAKSVPNSGNITGILVNPSVRGNNIDYITSNNDIEIFTNLSNIKGKEQTFKTYTRTKSKSYYFVYNNSHVTNEDNLGGTIIFADDKVLYVDLDNLEKYRYNENGSLNITGIVIEDNYIAEKLKQLLLKQIIAEDEFITEEVVRRCEAQIRDYIMSHSSKNGDIGNLSREYSSIMRTFDMK